MAEDDDDSGLGTLAYEKIDINLDYTWMIKMIMGFLGSYWDGLPPSRIPP